GTVTFYDGAAALGTDTLNGSSVATLSSTTLPVGSDSITATYTAAGNFAASSSSQAIPFAPIGSRTYGSGPFAVTATSSLGSSYPVAITVQSGPAVISGGIVSLTGAGTVVLLASQAGNTDHSAVTSTQSFQAH